MRVIVIESRTRTRYEVIGLLAEMGHDVSGSPYFASAVEALERHDADALVVGHLDIDRRDPEFVDFIMRDRRTEDLAVLFIVSSSQTAQLPPLHGVGRDMIRLPVSGEQLDTELRRLRREVITARDSTGSLDRLRAPAALLMDLFVQAPDAYFLLGPAGQIIGGNERLSLLTECDLEDLIGSTFEDLGFLRYASDADVRLSPPTDTEEPASISARLVSAGGTNLAVRVETHTVRLVGTRCRLGRVRVETPQAERTQQTATLASAGTEAPDGFQSFYDPVTALPNRLLFLDRLDHALTRASRYQHLTGVLSISLDHYAEFTTRLKRNHFRDLLTEISRRLHYAARDGATVGRLGENEFAILAEGIGGGAEGRALAERVIEALRPTILVDGVEYRVTATIGIAVSQPGAQNAGNLLRDARAAMEYARSHGSAQPILFQDRMREGVIRSLRLERDLDRALEGDELQLYFQPEVELESGIVTGVEALVRWEHPQHGTILPGEFLALAEESGLILPLSTWVLDEACRTVAGWRDDLHAARAIGVCVNIPLALLEEPNGVERVFAILERHALPASALRLEIDGNRGWNAIAPLSTPIARLRDRGVHVAVQDIDHGNWRAFDPAKIPVDRLKIEQTAIGLSAPDPHRSLQRIPLSSFASRLGIEVIVTGIETAHHLARARIFGFDYGQGYYFHKPAPASDIAAVFGGSPERRESKSPTNGLTAGAVV